MFKNNKKGLVALPTLLIIGSIIVDIAIALAAGVSFLINSDYGVRKSMETLAAAKAGAYDGIMKLARDKTYDAATQDYNLAVTGDISANVVVCKETACGYAADSGKHKISSTATFLTRRKKMEAVAFVASTTGAVTLESLQEVAY